MSTPSKIETARLTLRRWQSADADALSAMNADPDVTAWLARGPMSVDEASDVIARFDAHFDAHGFGPWAVERRADAMLIGVCGLSHEVRATHPMAPCVEIMWRQARHAWGHGYVAEAAVAALVDGFGRIGLGEIFAWTADTNLRSQRVTFRQRRMVEVARCVGTSCMPLAPPAWPARNGSRVFACQRHVPFCSTIR